MKQTAVDWLIRDVNENIAPLYIPKQVIEQAKAMEKEQMEDIYIGHNQYNDEYETFEQYYNQTFKSE